MGYFQDSEFQETMLSLMVRDQKFLRRVSGLLSGSDFEPGRDDGMGGKVRQWIAETSLQFWKDYREPIGGWLKTEAMDYIRENRNKLGKPFREQLLQTIERIRDPEFAIAVEAIEKKILNYKQRQKFRQTIEKLIELQGKNELTPSTFQQAASKAIVGGGILENVVDYGETLEQRILRRNKEKGMTLPLLDIDPFDETVRIAPRGQLAVVLAKYGVGKSVFMVHVAKSFAMQGYNVLFFTLEDPVEMVENRLDSSLCGIPLLMLESKSEPLRKRFQRQWERMRAKIQLVNATGGGWTVERMRQLWETMRNRNFIADLVIVDYDKKIEPPRRYNTDSAERMQSSDIYIELNNWTAKDQLFMWVAAQARRGPKGKERQMEIRGDDAAEDINKLREAALCIGIGYGPPDFPEDSRFIYIAKHRFDMSMMGWPIVGNFRNGQFFDREKTQKWLEVWNTRQDKKPKSKPQTVPEVDGMESEDRPKRKYRLQEEE